MLEKLPKNDENGIINSENNNNYNNEINNAYTLCNEDKQFDHEKNHNEGEINSQDEKFNNSVYEKEKIDV